VQASGLAVRGVEILHGSNNIRVLVGEPPGPPQEPAGLERIAGPGQQ
jgi:hypothetical protein